MKIGIVRALCLVFIFAIALVTSFWCDLFTGAIVLALEVVFVLEMIVQDNSQDIIKLEDASYEDEMLNSVKIAFAKTCGQGITDKDICIEKSWNSADQCCISDRGGKACNADVDIYLCSSGSEYAGQVKMLYNVATGSFVVANVCMVGSITSYSYWPDELMSGDRDFIELWERL